MLFVKHIKIKFVILMMYFEKRVVNLFQTVKMFIYLKDKFMI